MFDLKTKVLVVDDMFAMRHTVVANLKEIGFTSIAEAENGLKAWTLLEKDQAGYGLVISDLNMPELDGLGLFEKMKADPKLNQVPFVVVSADSDLDKVVTAVSKGVKGYIVKPFTSAAFKEKLESISAKLGK